MVLIQSCPSENALRAIFAGIGIWHMITAFLWSSTAFVMLLILRNTKLDDPRRKFQQDVFIMFGVTPVIQALVSAYLIYRAFMVESCSASWTMLSLYGFALLKTMLILINIQAIQTNSSPTTGILARSFETILHGISKKLKKKLSPSHEEMIADEQDLVTPSCRDTEYEDDDSEIGESVRDSKEVVVTDLEETEGQ